MNKLLSAFVGALMLTGCSTGVDVKFEPVEPVDFTLPRADTVDLDEIRWILVSPTKCSYKGVEYVTTPEKGPCVQQVFDEMADDAVDPLIIGVSDNDYEDLSVNTAKLLQVIRQQRAIILEYERINEERVNRVKESR